MNIEGIMELVLDFGANFADGSVTDLIIEGGEIKSAIEQYVKEERDKMRSECMAALGLLMLKELKKGADEKTISTIDECSTAVALIK